VIDQHLDAFRVTIARRIVQWCITVTINQIEIGTSNTEEELEASMMASA